MTKYLLINWPEIQDYMDSDRWEECYSAISCDISVESGVWFVPEDLVEEINNKIPESEFIFDGQIFTRDFWEINAGDLVCFSNQDKAWTSYCIIAGKGYMPDIYEHGECPGIDCFIEGIKI